MNFPAASPRTSSPLRRFLLGAILPCLVFFIPPNFSRVASAQPQGLPSPHTTLIFFADHPMRDEQWTSLFDALHRGQTDLAASTPALSGEVNFLRGDNVAPGLRVETGIVVYLHGDCTLMPRPRRVVMGRLGWVPRANGRIQPFVNVDCGRIVEMLGPLALGMNSHRRNTVMAEAMARVILHEWIHFSTQDAKHSKDGVSKSQFTLADLLADDAPPATNQRSRNRIRWPRL